MKEKTSILILTPTSKVVTSIKAIIKEVNALTTKIDRIMVNSNRILTTKSIRKKMDNLNVLIFRIDSITTINSRIPSDKEINSHTIKIVLIELHMNHYKIHTNCRTTHIYKTNRTCQHQITAILFVMQRWTIKFLFTQPRK